LIARVFDLWCQTYSAVQRASAYGIGIGIAIGHRKLKADCDSRLRLWSTPTAICFIGAQDGIISNVKGCNTAFDIQSLRCSGGTDSGNSCLSDAQLVVVQKITSDYKPGFKIAGADSFPKWALLEGSLFRGGVGSTFGVAPKPGPSGSDIISAIKNGLLFSVGEQTVKYIITRNPDQKPLSFDEKQWQERIMKVGAIMDVTNISLDKFRAKGGKIILTHGTTDDWITPYNSIAYYERQIHEFTKPVVDHFIRFYMIPGFGHGFGPFNAQFESLPALQDWVEKGKAPDLLKAIDGNPNAKGTSSLLTELPKTKKRWTMPESSKKNNVEDLTRCLQAVVDHPVTYFHLRSAAYDRAHAVYSWEHVIDRYEQLFATMTRRKSTVGNA
jgi:hypothetical protein